MPASTHIKLKMIFDVVVEHKADENADLAPESGEENSSLVRRMPSFFLWCPLHGTGLCLPERAVSATLDSSGSRSTLRSHGLRDMDVLEEEGDSETARLENRYLFNHSLSSVFQRADLTSDKDLYLDNSSVEEASGVYPIDDDDYSSGSGSGAEEEEESAVITTSRTLPKIPTISDASKAETTTMKMQTKMPAQTKSPEEIDKEERSETDAKKNSDEPGDDTDVFTEKHSENLFQRTEVLAAVIAGGVIGFLFAIFLILLLVYRMRKKDEGSYDLGERKPSSAAYQKAPTKEFYA
nr:PREDICTED: syndecan-2 [Apteryx mantelli mantelli]